MTTPSPWLLADTDPVGAATGWLAGYAPLAALLAEQVTGDGPQVGAVNRPPFPRLVIVDTNNDLREFTGLTWVSLAIDVLGDPNGRQGKAMLWRLAMATAESLREMNTQPAIGGCVFTEVTVNGLRWSPLPPTDQPRYVLTTTLWFHPVRS